MIVDLFLVYQFVKRLAMPFTSWPAYKLGIIDENGNILKKRKDLTTFEEKRAFGWFDLMLLNMKKLLATLPGGATKIATYAAALWLIKEHKVFTSDSTLTESISDEDILESISRFSNGYSDYTTHTQTVNKKVQESAPTNAVSSGATAGMGSSHVDDGDDIDAKYIAVHFHKHAEKMRKDQLKLHQAKPVIADPHMPDPSKAGLKEDGMSAGGGAVAGIGVGPDGEPGLTKKNQRDHKKRAAAVLRRKIQEMNTVEDPLKDHGVRKTVKRPKKPVRPETPIA